MLTLIFFLLLERQILKTLEEREREFSTLKADSREELRKAVLVKMKNVTNANETVCIELLESHSYDLKTSIEAYFQS